MQSYRRGELCFPGKLAALSAPRAFYSLLGSLRRKAWVVYSKPPFGGAEHVLKYLARYTHRVQSSSPPLVVILLRATGMDLAEFRNWLTLKAVSFVCCPDSLSLEVEVLEVEVLIN
jgi:putative transposase